MAKLRDAVPLYPFFFSPFLPPGSLRYYILLRRRCSFMISDGRCFFFFFNSCTILDLISTHELQLLPNWIWQLPNLTFTLKVIRVPKQLIGMFTVRKPLSCFSCPFYVFFFPSLLQVIFAMQNSAIYRSIDIQQAVFQLVNSSAIASII